MRSVLVFILTFFISFNHFGQDISLYKQFNGRYDYTAIGNTLNVSENGPGTNCTILTSSSAELNLQSEQVVQAAFLYWAGSGSGDFDITLNDVTITAERTFSDSIDPTRIFFSAFADVTDIIVNQGNGLYTLSNFDLSAVIGPFCPTGTNFGGWAITIIYQDNNLPLNQINVYDGLQSVPTNLIIELTNLNVFDNQGAKIGFVAWEGDEALAVTEILTINGNVIGNPPLNPTNNAFNGTNSFTAASNLYNMDIDYYDIQNNIAIGDTSATIELTSGQDFVMINNIITVLNSQLPDATVSIDNYELNCNSREVEVNYTIHNDNSTAVLPSQTPISFYIENQLVEQTSTISDIPISGSEAQTISLLLPMSITGSFTLLITVDDDGSGTGQVTEIVEINNSTTQSIDVPTSAPIIDLPTLLSCDQGFNSSIFDLLAALEFVDSNFDTETASFYIALEDAHSDQNEIISPSDYQNNVSPQSIYIRIDASPCYQLFQFLISVENCPPIIPQGFSPNDDGYNDWFNIKGLYDVFEQHELLIYNRFGTLIFKGNNALKWYGIANQGLNDQGKQVPVGTYFYVLNLNDPNFKPMTGWVYLNY